MMSLRQNQHILDLVSLGGCWGLSTILALLSGCATVAQQQTTASEAQSQSDVYNESEQANVAAESQTQGHSPNSAQYQEIEGGADGNFDADESLSNSDEQGQAEGINNVVIDQMDEQAIGLESNLSQGGNIISQSNASPLNGSSQQSAVQNLAVSNSSGSVTSSNGALTPNTAPITTENPPRDHLTHSHVPSAQVAGQAPAGMGQANSAPGTLTWVGYHYNKNERKLDVQIVVDGAPVYRIFREVNRGGQSELVVRYLNTRLRPKLRRDLDASEFRSPVAYIRMRHDPSFVHTDVVLTLREDAAPMISSKASNIMLSFAVGEHWFAPTAAEKPVASAQLLEDVSIGLDGVAGTTATGGPKPQNSVYTDDPGRAVFSGHNDAKAVPLVPKTDSDRELTPKSSTEDSGALKGRVPSNDSAYVETSYSVLGVAQADMRSTQEAAFDATQLLEDIPVNQVEQNLNPVANGEMIGVAAGSTDANVVSTKKVMRLEFRDAPISQILRMISNETKINFVISPEAGERRTTVSLKEVPWDVALKVVLESTRMGMQEIAPGVVRVDFLKVFSEDREAQERARQATEALLPTKVMVMPLNYAKAEDAVKLAEAMLPKSTESSNVAQERNYKRFKVYADARTNSVVVEATPKILSSIKVLLEKLDSQTPQVRIASRMVEVISNVSDAMGFKWGTPFSFDAGRGLGFGQLPFPNSITSSFSVDTGLSSKNGGSAAVRLGSINNVVAVDMMLKMYEERNMAETIHTQDVVVQDNETAMVQHGSSDFFEILGTDKMPGSLVEVAYNLALNVQPHITADGAVQMKLEIKGDSPSKTTGGRAKKETRSLKTTLLKQSGETAVIGGLYESRVSKLVTGVPFLSQIPLIGALFRSTETSNGKKDLLIMVTPTIIGQGGMTTDAGAIIDYPGPGSAGVQQSNSAADNAATNSTSETNSQNQAEVQENSNSADLLPTNASNESNNL